MSKIVLVCGGDCGLGQARVASERGQVTTQMKMDEDDDNGKNKRKVRIVRWNAINFIAPADTINMYKTARVGGSENRKVDKQMVKYRYLYLWGAVKTTRETTTGRTEMKSCGHRLPTTTEWRWVTFQRLYQSSSS